MFGHEIFTTIKNRRTGANDNNDDTHGFFTHLKVGRRLMNVSKNSLPAPATHSISVVNASKQSVRSIIVLSHYEEAAGMRRLGSLSFFHPSSSKAGAGFNGAQKI